MRFSSCLALAVLASLNFSNKFAYAVVVHATAQQSQTMTAAGGFAGFTDATGFYYHGQDFLVRISSVYRSFLTRVPAAI